jgi:P27 family predicted phage terminase small subunit
MPNYPKPTAIRKLEGNLGRRPFNQREPHPDPVEPDIPTYLNATAKREWRKLAPVLQRMRVLTEADGVMLANLCISVATLRQIRQTIDMLEKQSGGSALLVENKRSGMVVVSPLIRQLHREAELQIKICREFGLSPSSRARVEVEGHVAGPQAPLLARIAPRPKIA